MKKREITIQIISILLLALWIYTTISKLMDIELFKTQLSRQPLLSEWAGVMVWLLPFVEMSAAILLLFAITRKAGMLLSFSLMSIFTVYVGLAVFGLWENIPCSCGGVLNQLGWKEHLWFNLFFNSIAGIGLFLLRKEKTFHFVDKLLYRRAVFRPDLRAKK